MEREIEIKLNVEDRKPHILITGLNIKKNIIGVLKVINQFQNGNSTVPGEFGQDRLDIFVVLVQAHSVPLFPHVCARVPEVGGRGGCPFTMKKQRHKHTYKLKYKKNSKRK